MRRLGVILATIALVTAAAPVAAQDFEEHPHMLLLGLEFDETGEPIGFRKCVDLAGNRRVPLHAHHEHLHFGDSGVSFGGKAGHAVVPAAPFPAPFDDPVPWSNCAEFIAIVLGE